MKLQHFTNKPLTESLQEMVMVSLEPHTNDKGDVETVIIKYRTKESIEKEEEKSNQKNSRRF